MPERAGFFRVKDLVVIDGRRYRSPRDGVALARTHLVLRRTPSDRGIGCCWRILVRYVAGYRPSPRSLIQSFQTRAPDAYRQAIRDTIEPYYDERLDDRIRNAINAAQREAYQAVREAIGEHRGWIEALFDELASALDEYEDELSEDFETIRDGLDHVRDREKTLRTNAGIPAAVDEIEAALDRVDIEEPLEDIEVSIPPPDADGAADPILDTDRAILEQLQAYQDFDVRYD